MKLVAKWKKWNKFLLNLRKIGICQDSPILKKLNSIFQKLHPMKNSIRKSLNPLKISASVETFKPLISKNKNHQKNKFLRKGTTLWRTMKRKKTISESKIKSLKDQSLVSESNDKTITRKWEKANLRKGTSTILAAEKKMERKIMKAVAFILQAKISIKTKSHSLNPAGLIKIIDLRNTWRNQGKKFSSSWMTRSKLKKKWKKKEEYPQLSLVNQEITSWVLILNSRHKKSNQLKPLNQDQNWEGLLQKKNDLHIVKFLSIWWFSKKQYLDH